MPVTESGRRVLVVGGAGYVGAVLSDELLRLGYRVRVLDRLYFGADGLRGIRERVELVVADMRAVGPEVLDGVDAVVNVGGMSNDPTAEYNPRANHEMNTEAALALARACTVAGVRRYVLASSCSVYDRGVVDEEADLVRDERAPVAPRAPYARSKYEAERGLLALAGPGFCPVVLRKGTVYGFSPRMRYDLVVNTFVKDALARGALALHLGGEMWRPLVDVRDAARAYVALLEADESLVRGEVFNLAFQNMRISEVALRVREALRSVDVAVDLRPSYTAVPVRCYRVSSEKLRRVLGVQAKVTVEEAVVDMVERIRSAGDTDFEHPRYYNIRWLRLLEEAQGIIGVTGTLFEAPAAAPGQPPGGAPVTTRRASTE
jgi:nucleoside-diphosphate-sugar epimerase